MPEEIRQALENDLRRAFDLAADMGGINVRQLQDILGPRIGPQIAAMWDLPALVENPALQLAPGRAWPRPQRRERIFAPPHWLRHAWGGGGQNVCLETIQAQ